MTKFHQRFKIDIDINEAKRKFVNRVHNEVFDSLLFSFSRDDKFRLERRVLTHLGERPQPHLSFSRQIGDDFERTLQAVEGIHAAFTNPGFQRRLDLLINRLIEAAERDVEIEWRDGKFWPAGAKVLDEALVNENLDWLSHPGFETVVEPFEKALGHLVDARKDSARLGDVVTDAYEALEAMAKIVVQSDRDLSAIRELFIKKVNASEEYRQLLKDYLEYVGRFRHAASEKRQKPELSYREAESFIYMTGIFLRLAMPEDSRSQ
jgi:hypothetical protein